jgi:hypothetical protein
MESEGTTQAYEEVCAAYDAQYLALENTRKKALDFCADLREALVSYFGLPSYWTKADGRSGGYFRFASSSFLDNGVNDFDFGHAHQCLTLTEGFWRIAWAITFDRLGYNYQNITLVTPLDFIVSGEAINCRFVNGGDKIYIIRNSNDFGSLILTYQDILLRHFRRRYRSDFEPEAKIGFVHSSDEREVEVTT